MEYLEEKPNRSIILPLAAAGIGPE